MTTDQKKKDNNFLIGIAMVIIGMFALLLGIASSINSILINRITIAIGIMMIITGSIEAYQNR